MILTVLALALWTTNMTCSCATQKAKASTAIVTFTGIFKMTLSKEMDCTLLGSLDRAVTNMTCHFATQGAKESTFIVIFTGIFKMTLSKEMDCTLLGSLYSAIMPLKDPR
jgi:hypothetical protein